MISAITLEHPVWSPRMASGWLAMTWTDERLAERGSHDLVTCYRTDAGHLTLSERTNLSVERVPLREALDHVRAGAAATLRVRARIDQELPALVSDLGWLAPLVRAGLLEASLWVSPGPTVSRLHFDQPHNVLVGLRGSKRVVLFSPWQTPWLYPRSPLSAAAQFSRLDLSRPLPADRSWARRARGVECTLAPGDALFIPGGWWHYVEHAEPCASLSLRWWPPTRAPVLAAASLYKRARRHSR
ncbi:MAG: cupin-like domain-containing protein [Myxococcales bacterium]|nr:cupin-like domain-containing protein [Myxococcales bacterium]